MAAKDPNSPEDKKSEKGPITPPPSVNPPETPRSEGPPIPSEADGALPSSSVGVPPPSGAPSSSARRAPSVKSQVSISDNVYNRPVSMTTAQFLAYRRNSSIGTPIIPIQFFQTKEFLRTWGAEEITDPSIQPCDKDSSVLPAPFHVSLPGYEPRLCKYAIWGPPKEDRDPMLGPEITIFPPTWVPQWALDPNFKPQRYGFDWKESDTYKMERLPYVNAEMEPISPEASRMYDQAYPYTAYPYGVPRVP